MATLYEERKKGRKAASDAVFINEIEPRKRVIFDKHRDAPKGFGLRVTDSGRKVFVLRYLTDAGRDRRLDIGDHGTWSLSAARDYASDLRQEVDRGGDPIQRRDDQAAESTVKDVFERYCKAHVDKLASGKAVRATLSNHLLPALGKRKITEVRRRDVIAVVEKLAQEKGRQAALLLTYTKGLFAWAEDREIIEANPVATIKPGKIDKALSPRKRARVLTDDEIRGVWNRTEPPEGMHRVTLLALRMILATGQRPGEVCGMRRSEIDGRWWRIPAERRGKTEDEHAVPLTETALAIMEEAGGQDYVFSARGGPVEVAAIGKAVKRCAKALGNQAKGAEGHWRPHDLRRTMRTGLAAAGVSETVAEAVIGHVRKGITGVYDRHRYDAEKRAAMEAWDRRLQRIAAGEDAGEDNVTSIAEGRA
jgi:integrase